MIPFKKKSSQPFKKIISKFFSKQSIKHALLVIFITLIIGLLLSLPVAKSTTVNDTTIKYTEPPVEELDTEGYNGEEQQGEAPVDAELPVQEEIPADVDLPAPEESPAEPETPVIQ